MSEWRFDRIIDTPEALRAIIPPPSELAQKKELPALDEHARRFIARSPLVMIGTCGRTRGCDVSPRGEAPGGFLVLDDRTIAIADRPGNRRNDTFLNLFENPKVGLYFVVPGIDDTLRVNGRGAVVADRKLAERLTVAGKAPALALVVDVEEVFFQCAKAFRRSKLWDRSTWPDPAFQPSLGRVLKDQIPACEMTTETLDKLIEDGNRNNLY